jgi:hypothetical protein
MNYNQFEKKCEEEYQEFYLTYRKFYIKRILNRIHDFASSLGGQEVALIFDPEYLSEWKEIRKALIVRYIKEHIEWVPWYEHVDCKNCQKFGHNNKDLDLYRSVIDENLIVCDYCKNNIGIIELIGYIGKHITNIGSSCYVCNKYACQDDEKICINCQKHTKLLDYFPPFDEIDDSDEEIDSDTEFILIIDSDNCVEEIEEIEEIKKIEAIPTDQIIVSLPSNPLISKKIPDIDILQCDIW